MNDSIETYIILIDEGSGNMNRAIVWGIVGSVRRYKLFAISRAVIVQGKE